MAVSSKYIDLYLDVYLEEIFKTQTYWKKKEICEAILDEKTVIGLNDYAKEVLALALEKKIVLTIEQYHINKQKPSFWEKPEIIEQIIKRKNNFLKDYINLFIQKFDGKTNEYVNKTLKEIEKFYDEKIETASKDFKNRMFVLPNKSKASVKDLMGAILECVNFSSSEAKVIKKKVGTLKNVAAITGLIGTLCVGAFAQYVDAEEDNIKVETITEDDNQDIEKTIEGSESQIVSVKYDYVSQGNVKNVITMKNVFVGYDNECPREHQEYMYEMSKKYNIPYNVLMTIADNESDGLFNANGVKSKWKDYGVFQINECNHELIKEIFNYTSDDLLYDYKKNTEAACYLLSEIFKMYPEDIKNGNYENVFGTYNGWENWREKETSIEYVANAMMKMDEIYNKTDEELFLQIQEVSNEKTR